MEITPPQLRVRSVVREVLVVTFFVLASVLMTWPLAKFLDRAISDPGDPFFTTWAIDWGYHATFTSAKLFDANIFFPARNALAFSEHMYGMAVLLFPLLALGVAPLTAHNIGMLAGFAGCGYAMYLLARYATGSTAPGLIAGICYAFVGFRFHHLPHLHFVWSLWLPILLLIVLLLAERPSMKLALLFAVAIAMNGLTSLHWFVFGMTAVVATAAINAAIRKRWDKRFWMYFAIGCLLAAIVMMPFLWPYHVVTKEYGMERHFDEAYPHGAQWRDWFYAYYKSTWYARWSSDEAIGRERTLFPGLITLTLALLGTLTHYRRRPSQPAAGWLRVIDAMIICVGLCVVAALMIGEVRLKLLDVGILSFTGSGVASLILTCLILVRILFSRRADPALREPVAPRLASAMSAALIWVMIGLLGSRGLRGFFHAALFDLFEPFRGIRVPSRWAMISYVGLSLLAAVGANHLFQHRAPVRRYLSAAVLIALVLAESWVRPIRWYMVPLDSRPVYEWLATVPIAGAVVELPMDQAYTYEYLWRSTTHHRPLINGVSSYTPPSYASLWAQYQAEPIPDELFPALHRAKCSLIVVHEGLLRERGATIRAWLARGVASGALTFVRRFDEGGSAAWVFALAATEPTAARWRTAEVRDPAGRTPTENANIFLETGGWTYTAGPIHRVDSAPDGIIRGPLTFAGWVVAPDGIKEVNLRFANGRYTYGTKRYARPDVREALPWHPDTSRAGFMWQIDQPPAGIDGETDLQIEFITGSGKVVRRSPFFFTWREKISAPRWKETALNDLLHRLAADEAAAPRLIAGTSAIQDFIPLLMSDPEHETDALFAERVVSVLLGYGDRQLTNRSRRALLSGVSRRRIVQNVMTSRQFAATYLERGVITPD